MTKVAVLLISIVLFVGGGAGLTAYAAQDALPGDALYGIKAGVQEVLGDALSVLGAGSAELDGDDIDQPDEGQADEPDAGNIDQADDGAANEPDDGNIDQAETRDDVEPGETDQPVVDLEELDGPSPIGLSED